MICEMGNQGSYVIPEHSNASTHRRLAGHRAHRGCVLLRPPPVARVVCVILHDSANGYYAGQNGCGSLTCKEQKAMLGTRREYTACLSLSRPVSVSPPSRNRGRLVFLYSQQGAT